MEKEQIREGETKPENISYKETFDNSKYECDICGNTFGNKYLLSNHVKRVHGKSTNYQCEICKKMTYIIVKL